MAISLLQIQNHHQIALIEAGISEKGEMEKLEKMIQPTLGIFTNIGEAHQYGFKSIDEKLNEKLSLFTNVNTVICDLSYESKLAVNSKNQYFLGAKI